jgi:hypothetical protein
MEERVIGYFYLVVVDAGRAGVQADWIRVADEVHLVSTQRQLQAELRRHDAAPAVCGIARDPDLQRLPPRSVG